QAEPASSCCPRMRVRCWRRMSTTPAVARATVAAQWLKCRARDGQHYCAVPSSIADRYHLTARQASTCPDLERRARGRTASRRYSSFRFRSVRVACCQALVSGEPIRCRKTALGGFELSSRFSPAGGASMLRTSLPGQDQRLEQRTPERKDSE